MTVEHLIGRTQGGYLEQIRQSVEIGFQNLSIEERSALAVEIDNLNRVTSCSFCNSMTSQSINGKSMLELIQDARGNSTHFLELLRKELEEVLQRKRMEVQHKLQSVRQAYKEQVCTPIKAPKESFSEIVSGFIKYISNPAMANRISYMQLVGKLENQLSLELSRYIHAVESNTLFSYTNFGKSNEPRFDLVVTEHDPVSKTNPIRFLAEAKYLRNRHRNWNSNASDEDRGSLNDLRTQCTVAIPQIHGDHPVMLLGIAPSIWAIVFVSHTEVGNDRLSNKLKYLTRVTSLASELGFTEPDGTSPILQTVYTNQTHQVQGSHCSCSLSIGLWLASVPT